MLCSAVWEELDGRALVPRDSTRENHCVSLCYVCTGKVQESTHNLSLFRTGAVVTLKGGAVGHDLPHHKQL